jgi:cysteine desulfurase
VRMEAGLTGHVVGGSQERRRRAGTENVPAIAGFGAAAAVAREEAGSRAAFLARLRDHFEAGLRERIPEAVVHCRQSPRLPNTSHLAIPGVEGESLLIRLDLAGFAVSTGAACSSGSVEPSKTLLAAGISRAEALSSLRVSFGITNSLAEVDAFVAALAREAAELRRAVA